MKSDKLATYAKPAVDQQFKQLVHGCPKFISTSHERPNAIPKGPKNHNYFKCWALNQKVDKATSCTKADLYLLINNKVGELTTYSKIETNNASKQNADASTTYSKNETDQKINLLINGAPDLLNTWTEISNAIANDPNYATTMTNALYSNAGKPNTYLKSEVDTALNLQSDKTNTCAKTKANNELCEMLLNLIRV